MKRFKQNTLLKNTAMLYILQFSNYFLGFATLPYQTRVLGPKMYGVIGVALAVMTYFQLFMDFGFMLSATEDISKNRDNREYVNKKLTSVTVLKCFLAVISVCLMVVLCCVVPNFREYSVLYIIYIFAYAINAFVPDYLYRGIENMTPITVRTVTIKLFFTVMIFVFLKEPEDILVVPTLTLIGNSAAVAGCYIHLTNVLKYKFVRISKNNLINDFRSSLTFFFSRIASTVYSTANTIILGFIDSSGLMTGFYTSADKAMTISKNAFSPISDSLYPYMIKNKDFRLVKKVLVLFMPVIVVGGIIVFIFAEPLCIIAFGKEYAQSAPILRAMIPAIIAILPSYILGFPTLGAMGLSKYANVSVVIGTVVHIAGLFCLFMFNSLSAVSLAIMTSVSEWSILVFRLIIVLKNKGQFN